MIVPIVVVMGVLPMMTVVVMFVVVIVLALRSAGRTRTLHIRPSVC